MLNKILALLLIIILPSFGFARIRLDDESILGKYKVEYAGAFSSFVNSTYELNIKLDNELDFLTFDQSGQIDPMGLNCDNGDYVLENEVLIAHLYCIDGKPESDKECTKILAGGKCFIEITTVVNLSNTTPEALKAGVEKRIHLSNKGFSNAIPTRVTKID